MPATKSPEMPLRTLKSRIENLSVFCVVRG
jgi:hypothetical protein